MRLQAPGASQEPSTSDRRALATHRCPLEAWSSLAYGRAAAAPWMSSDGGKQLSRSWSFIAWWSRTTQSHGAIPEHAQLLPGHSPAKMLSDPRLGQVFDPSKLSHYVLTDHNNNMRIQRAHILFAGFIKLQINISYCVLLFRLLNRHVHDSISRSLSLSRLIRFISARVFLYEPLCPKIFS